MTPFCDCQLEHTNFVPGILMNQVDHLLFGNIKYKLYLINCFMFDCIIIHDL
jgi:hypothetical protein